MCRSPGQRRHGLWELRHRHPMQVHRRFTPGPRPVAGSKRRPGSPSPGAFDDKRQRVEAGPSLETDFTMLFSSNRQPQPAQHAQPLVVTSVEPKDSCELLQRRAHIVCADALASTPTAAAAARQPGFAADAHAAAVRKRRWPATHGGHRDRDYQASKIAIDATESRRKRAGGPTFLGMWPQRPGHCAQCLADPKSWPVLPLAGGEL